MSDRWTYTSVSYEYDAADKVVAYSGSIHAGWEDAPTFNTQEEYYDWAKRECSKRNLLEAAAPDLLAALKVVLNHPLIRITGDVEPLIIAAIAKAEGRS